MSLFTVVPTGMVLTSGANSALTWTNSMSVSSINTSTLSAGLLNYSSIVGSSISTNSMTLSLTNASTQNTQIYQVATTNPTTSYTAIQASHVSTGTTNNALALNPSGGNVGVGVTTASAPLHVNTASSGLANGVLLVNSNNTLSTAVNSSDILQQWSESTGNGSIVNLLWNRTSAGSDWTTASQRFQAKTDATWQGFIEFNGTNNNNGVTIGAGNDTSNPNNVSSVMTIKTGGNVGIGYTTPAATLHVLNQTPQAGNTTMVTAQIIGRPVTVGVQDGTSCGFAIGASGGLPNAASRMDVMVGGTAYAGNNWGYTPDIPVATFLGSGNVGIGKTDPAATLHVLGPAVSGADVLNIWGTFGGTLQLFNVVNSANASSGNWGAAAAIVLVTRDTVTDRSINAAGTFNASGADYAEYMTKDSDFPALKGDLLGVLPSGKLTNQFDDAIHFLLKSTNPCMVGGDVWGTEAIVGEKPKNPEESATEEEKAAHAAALADWEARLEAERQKVDRMAFAGQVPVNIQGTTPGDYIIPVRNADGTIGVAAVSKADMTFSQYQSAVGRVISILADGRANVIVKAV